ncbi:MAG: 50S ribosomal protein L13 [Patescibacteria group bacterium]|nr:50S ribosomal protein L13 [Patescibacteria group bacterium]
MKTFSPKKSELEKKWYLVDMKDQTLGHAATRIANILRGKDKPLFAPHLDCGDYVVVVNAKHIKLSGRKLDQKMYYRHSGYPGALKSRSAADVLEGKNPEKVVRNAVSGMLPKNKLRKNLLLNLKVFPEGEHTHEAQKPEKIKL